MLIKMISVWISKSNKQLLLNLIILLFQYAVFCILSSFLVVSGLVPEPVPEWAINQNIKA